MQTLDVMWKIAVLLLLASIGGSLGIMAQAFKMQAEAFIASLQDEG